jgi:hypothetical protein
MNTQLEELKNDLRLANDNLTAVHDRCNALFKENRRLRGVPEE